MYTVTWLIHCPVRKAGNGLDPALFFVEKARIILQEVGLSDLIVDLTDADKLAAEGVSAELGGDILQPALASCGGITKETGLMRVNTDRTNAWM